MKGTPLLTGEVRYAAEQFQSEGRTFKDIAHELDRDRRIIAKHVWKYLRDMENRT
jgi:hypothetical protein